MRSCRSATDDRQGQALSPARFPRQAAHGWRVLTGDGERWRRMKAWLAQYLRETPEHGRSAARGGWQF